MNVSGGRIRFEPGFSLLELVVALLLFQVGLLAVAGMVFQAQENIRRSERIMRGTTEALRKGDSLLASGVRGEGEVQEKWGKVTWAPGGKGTGGLGVWALGPEEGDTLVLLRLWPWPVSGSLAGSGGPVPPGSALRSRPGSDP